MQLDRFLSSWLVRSLGDLVLLLLVLGFMFDDGAPSWALILAVLVGSRPNRLDQLYDFRVLERNFGIPPERCAWCGELGHSISTCTRAPKP